MGLRAKLQHLGFEDVLEVPPLGRSGGIMVTWKRGVIFYVSSVSDHFVNLIVKSDPPDQHWVFSFVYGPSLWNEK